MPAGVALFCSCEKAHCCPTRLRAPGEQRGSVFPPRLRRRLILCAVLRGQMVEGEVPEGGEDGGAWGSGAMAWTEGSGEAVLEFASTEERDDALDALVKATDEARAGW